jgi:hypothetical protein
MRIRALQTFTIALPNGMVALNAAKGKVKANEAEIDDHIAQQYVDAGMAEIVKGKPAKDPLDHDGDVRKGGVAPAAEPTKDEASNEAAEDKAP